MKCVEQTVTQRSDKRKKQHSDWNSEALAADIKDLMPSVKQITSDLKQLHETLNISEGKGTESCMILEERYETILNAIRNSIPPQLPEEDTLGTSLIPYHLSYLELYRVLVMEIVCLIQFPYLNLEMRMLQVFFD